MAIAGGGLITVLDLESVVRREVLEGTAAFAPAAGVSVQSYALVDTAVDGSRVVSLLIDGVGPYVSGVGSATWGTVASSLIPDGRTPVQFAHASNMGLGQITPDGILTFQWGTFGSTGSTSLTCVATYPILAP